MALPNYIPVRTVGFRGVLELEQGKGLTAKVAVRSSGSLRWADTGELFETLGGTFTSGRGASVTFPLPVTDDDGWLTTANEIIDVSEGGAYTHTYTATVVVMDASGRQVGDVYEYGPFVVPASDSTLWLDELEEQTTTAGSVVARPTVYAVNGQDGDVTITAAGLGAYVKPGTGVPKTDLAEAVQTSLGKADTALQPDDVGTMAAQDAADYLTADQTNAAFVGRPEFWADPSEWVNGAVPAASQSGHSLTTFGNAPITVSDGKLVHAKVATTNNAGYLQTVLSAESAWMTARFVHHASNPGQIAFVIPLAAWANGSLSAAPIHFVYEGSGLWRVSNWTGSAESPIYRQGYAAPVAAGSENEITLAVDREVGILTITLPDRSTVSISNSGFKTSTDFHVIWELYEDVNTKNPSWFTRIEAGSVNFLAQESPRHVAAVTTQKRVDGDATRYGLVTNSTDTTTNILTSTSEIARMTVTRPPTNAGLMVVRGTVPLRINLTGVSVLARIGWAPVGGAVTWTDLCFMAEGSKITVSATDYYNIGPNDLVPFSGVVAIPSDRSSADIVVGLFRYGGSDGNATYRLHEASGRRIFWTADPAFAA